MSREVRIYGPPGTGKTTHLKGRVEATVKARGGDGIRIASLTRAAAAEIGSRVTLDPAYVGTLHAHAYRALERPKLAEVGDGIESWNREAHKLGEAYVLHKRRVDLDDAAGEAMAPSTEGEGLLQAYQTLRARCAPREAWPPMVRAFAERWEAFKQRSDRFDFNDLIERAIIDVPAMPGSPSVLLLDEAQDMSTLDMKLARTWGAACDVFVVVGDPDQNLYGFRGAEPEAFEHGDCAERKVLEQSYRVPEHVHRYAVEWIADNLPTRSNAAYKARPERGAVERCPHIYRAPEGLVTELEDRLLRGQRVMVLATCGFHLEPLIAVLRSRGVPFGNPYRTNDGKLNPLAGAKRLAAYYAGMPIEFGGEGREWTWDEVRLWTEPLKADGVFERGAKSFIEGKCRGGGKFDEVKPGDVPAPFELVMSLLTDDAQLHLGLGSLDYFEDHLLSSKAGALGYSLNVVRHRGPSALRDIPKQSGAGLIVGTVHSVKGGEADVVYVFPDLSRQGFDGWLTPGPRHDAVARTFYVGFTRAREELHLCAPSSAASVSFRTPEEVLA